MVAGLHDVRVLAQHAGPAFAFHSPCLCFARLSSYEADASHSPSDEKRGAGTGAVVQDGAGKTSIATRQLLAS